MKNNRAFSILSAGAVLLLSFSFLTGCTRESSAGERLPDSSQAAFDASAGTAVTEPSAAERTLPAETTAVPVQPKQSDVPLSELVHCTAAEITEKMHGEYTLSPDDMIGCYYISNDAVFPQTRFYFVDNSFRFSDKAEFQAHEQEIRSMIASSGIEIDKINTYAGGFLVSDYAAGTPFADYADRLSSNTFSFGNHGEYFSGSPSSSAYSFSDAAQNARITLHFALNGDIQKKETMVLDQGGFPASLMAEENPELEVITIERTDGYPKAEFTAVIASSVRMPDVGADGAVTYEAAKAIDGSNATCWAVGTGGTGCGESIVLQAAEPQTISSICIHGGLCTDEQHFLKNGRPTKLTARFDDGSEYTIWISDKYENQGMSYYLCRGKKTQTLTLTVTEAAAGTENEYACISEIRFE